MFVCVAVVCYMYVRVCVPMFYVLFGFGAVVSFLYLLCAGVMYRFCRVVVLLVCGVVYLFMCCALLFSFVEITRVFVCVCLFVCLYCYGLFVPLFVMFVFGLTYFECVVLLLFVFLLLSVCWFVFVCDVSVYLSVWGFEFVRLTCCVCCYIVALSS